MGTLYLTECGYEVFTAENAAAAMRQAAKVKPDVIVLDLNLGGDSGITVMNLLTMAHPHVPILIYTGMPLDEGAINDLCDQGAHDCLRKGTMDELLAAVGEAVQAAPAQASAGETNDSGDGVAEAGIRSVLIVEDDVEFGDALRTYLESHPFCVTRVTDGAEALRQIQAEDFDLILCDIVLPNLPGDELHRAVERIKPYLCNRFVFMTGHHAHPSSDDFIRRAGALMMWKPFHLPDVLVAAETVRKKSLLKRCLTA
jgi:DNA-binding response OmpR family regulator